MARLPTVSPGPYGRHDSNLLAVCDCVGYTVSHVLDGALPHSSKIAKGIVMSDALNVSAVRSCWYRLSATANTVVPPNKAVARGARVVPGAEVDIIALGDGEN